MRFFKTFFTLTFCAVALLLSAASSFAEEDFIPPGEVVVKTPAYEPNEKLTKLKLGTYKYETSWSGIPAAETTVTLDKEGSNYVVTTKVKTYSAIDLLYKLRYDAQGRFNASSFLPVSSTFQYKENSRQKETWMSFLPDGKIHSFRIKDKKESEEYHFDPNNFTLDPFSAAFMARSLSWEKGQTRDFDTFNGRTRYLISFTYKGKSQIEINNKKRKVLVFSPKVRKLSMKNPDPGKLRAANIYISDDADRNILEIKSEVFIGSVRTKLVDFKPSREKIVLASNSTNTKQQFLR